MTLTAVKLDDIKTQDDLLANAISPPAASTEGMRYNPPDITTGIGKNKERTYVTAWVLALDDAGVERKYKIKINDQDKRTIESQRVSQNQHNIWEEAE